MTLPSDLLYTHQRLLSMPGTPNPLSYLKVHCMSVTCDATPTPHWTALYTV